MKVGGGLNYVVGPMGSGKSYYAVRKLVRHVVESEGGRYCITNVRLYDDVADRVARHYAPASRRRRQQIADKFARFYVYESSLEEAMRYRVPGRGEARALFIWDETHNDLNNRSWRQDGRGLVLEWATQLRKLGYVGFLLSQHRDNTDAQLRRVCNNIVALQNQRERTRLFGIRATPWPLFLACWFPAHLAISSGGTPKPDAIERYFLGWFRNLYDTHDLYHGLDDLDGETDVIRLPAGGRAVTQSLPSPAAADAPALLPVVIQSGASAPVPGRSGRPETAHVGGA